MATTWENRTPQGEVKRVNFNSSAGVLLRLAPDLSRSGGLLKLRVVHFDLNASGAGDLQFVSSNPQGATEIYRIDYGAAGDKVRNSNHDGWTQTLERGDELVINNPSSLTIKGMLAYVEIG
jgi:hypothetical protein